MGTKMRSRVMIVVVLVFAFSSLVIPVANAYIDPGSGSFIVQMAIGALLGVSVTLKMFWGRFMAFFSRRKQADHEVEKPPAGQ